MEERMRSNRAVKCSFAAGLSASSAAATSVV